MDPGERLPAYKSKSVSRISLPDREQRDRILEDAGYNVFDVDAADVYVDMLTDSGTGAMSDEQWAALMRGDESYAGAESFRELEAAVEDVMGFSRIVPAHQGRGAENVLYGVLVDEGDVVLNNTHFDTTRAHVANQGARPVDCPVEGAHDREERAPFKGNFSVERAREVVAEVGAERVPVVVLTVTSNSVAGQPVSVENTREVAAFAEEIDATFVIDACRFAENAYFVREREADHENREIVEIARDQLGYADALVMSGKKDGLVNVGGFVAVADDPDLDDLYARCEERGILYEGFPTYGGMAGRDMAAMAVGLREAVESAYVADRVGEVRELAALLDEAGVPFYRPVGGHAVYLDAEACLPHVPREQYPGQALTVELYREGGVRGVELGSFAFPGEDRPEFVRLAIPRRTYHREHFAHVAGAAGAVLDRAEDVPGYEVIEEPETSELRHFSATLSPLE